MSINTTIPYLKLLVSGMVAIAAFDVKAQDVTQKNTPSQSIDALHSAFGVHNARAVHAKGIILLGTFTPANTAASLTQASHFQKKSSPVTVRFSDFTGIPTIPDADPHANPRGFAVKFQLPDGSTTDIVSHSFNGFPVATSDEFHDLLIALSESGADAVKPTSLDKFLEVHPVAAMFLTTQKPAPVSYATIPYFGVNTFEFINTAGESKFIRYQFIPEAAEQYLSAEEITKADPNYLQKEIAERILGNTINYKLYAQIAKQDDKIKDPSIAWPEDRDRVLLGTIEIKEIAPNTIAEDKALFFIPNNLPLGIKIADPMLNFRSQAYPISVKERQ
jgi:catalase